MGKHKPTDRFGMYTRPLDGCEDCKWELKEIAETLKAAEERRLDPSYNNLDLRIISPDKQKFPPCISPGRMRQYRHEGTDDLYPGQQVKWLKAELP